MNNIHDQIYYTTLQKEEKGERFRMFRVEKGERKNLEKDQLPSFCSLFSEVWKDTFIFQIEHSSKFKFNFLKGDNKFKILFIYFSNY